MARIELTAEAAEVLRRALESYLSDLRMEISHTDRFDYREVLKREKETLIWIVESLPSAEVPAER